MRHPLPAGHELILRLIAKRIAHPAMATADTDAAAHCLAQWAELFAFDRSHRPDRHDEVEALEFLDVEERIKCIRHLHLESFSDKRFLKQPGHLVRLMSIPAAPHDQCFLVHAWE